MKLIKSGDAVISKDKAREIATRFLEQHHSVLDSKQAVLEGDVWTVKVSISSLGNQSRIVRIDAKSGKIVEWRQ